MTSPEFDAPEPPQFHVPRISFENPDYIKERYLFTLTELEHLFGELRNADEEGRLEIVEDILSTSDDWFDQRYGEIGITVDQRNQAAEIELQIVEHIKNLFGYDPDAED